MGVSTIPASGGGGLRPRYQKFTSSGTFTLPDGYGAANPLLVTIQVIGAGGGGTGARILGNSTFNKNTSFTGSFNSYFGNGNNITINTVTGPSAAPGSLTGINNINIGGSGGSGGIAQTQLSLTSNLVITVGAAGARAAEATVNTASQFGTPNFTDFSYTGVFQDFTNNSGLATYTNENNIGNVWLGQSTAVTAGGTGGTTTAGSISAAGGVGANGGTIVVRTVTEQPWNFQRYGTQNQAFNFGNTWQVVQYQNSTNGAGGSPAGTAGSATPLLGTIAGGSKTTTPVFGSYGVGGIKTDANTATGVEGTGGGFDSVGAPGAVILTWWA